MHFSMLNYTYRSILNLKTGLEHGAEQAPQFQALKILIKTGCKAAIAVSEKI